MGEQVHKKTFVLLLAAAYLFIALTHILFIRPDHSANRNAARYNSIFKRQYTDGTASPVLNFVKRTDKILSKGNPDVQALITKHTCSFVTLLIAPTRLAEVPPATLQALTEHGISPHLNACLRI